MPLTILTDAEVQRVLTTLDRDDILTIHKALADALHTYSTSTDDDTSGCCASNQPKRLVIKQSNGSNTLFMPASSDEALGVKVLTVAESSDTDETPLTSLEQLNMSPTSGGSTSSSSGASFSSPARTQTSSSNTSIQADSNSSRKSSSISNSGSSGPSAPIADSLKEPLGYIEPSATSPKGSITLLSHTGHPRALINASTLTAFRTAMASTLLLKARQYVHTLTVFGAGLQAFWHIYVTLILRGSELHHLNVINRDFTRAQRLLMSLGQSDNDTVSELFLSQKLRPGILTPEYGEYSRLLKEQVRAADVIYCCTPSTLPLFPATHLTHSEGRRKARYIACIGSYKPHMQELHEDVLRQAVAGPEEQRHAHHPHRPHFHIGHSHAHEGGAIIVDTIEGAMKEAGEVIKAGISGHGVVELGELVMLKRSHWAEKAERERLEKENGKTRDSKGHSKSNGGHGLGHLFKRHDAEKEEKNNNPAHAPHMWPEDGGLRQWLERGNVIYKSVGIGLMDVVVGMEIVRLAEERGIGTTVENF